MKFSVKTNLLLQSISKIIGIIPNRSFAPELENLSFELLENKLTITGTDTEVFIISEVSVIGEKDGGVLVPAKRLFETLKNQSEKTLTFVVEDEKSRVKLITETGSFHPGGMELKNFIETPKISTKEQITINGDVLKNLISNTVFAVSQDDLRPAMTGVYFKTGKQLLTAVSTDGHRLVRLTAKTENTDSEKEFIVPTKALIQLEKLINNENVLINLNETNISFNVGDTEIVSKLITEKYPNYNSVIPTDNHTTLKINKNETAQAVKIVSLYSNSITHQIKLNLKKNKMRISAEDAEYGGDAFENISCEFNGEEMEIGFNANYILEAFSHLKSEEVIFKLSTPSRAAIIVPAEQKKDEDVLMLVMSVRLNN